MQVGDLLKTDIAISPAGDIKYRAVYMSKPHRQSASIAKSEVRFIFSGLNDGAFVDITDIYLNLFSSLPVVGDKVLVKTIGFLENSGWTSKPTYQEDIITFV